MVKQIGKLICLISVVGFAAPGWSSEVERELPIEKIAFGSCNDQNKPQNFWQHIAEETPQLWLWLGDIIYADNTTPEDRWLEYVKVSTNPFYANFVNSGVKVTGIWDDHDYGANGAGSEYEFKEESKLALLRFLGVAAEEEVYSHEGIYRFYDFGPDNARLRVVLLDTRSFKEEPGSTQSLLGESQWQWLEDTLKDDEVDFFIVASGISISSDFGFGNLLEGWVQYEQERERLRGLLDTVPQTILLISGDRHSADYSWFELASGRKLVEFMSSGLTHSRFALPNPHRIGEPYTNTNFGTISIDWAGENPAVVLNIHSAEDGTTQRTLQLPE